MKFDLAGVKVMLVIPVNRDLPWQTAQSLVETVIELKDRGIDFSVQMIIGSSIIEVARSKAAGAFLKSDCNKLFMLDSDQSWKAKDFVRLLALSTEMDVVLAAYPAKRDPPTFLLSPIDGEVESNQFGCIPIKGIGLGFTVVSREVMEKLAKDAPKVTFSDSPEVMAHIFRCDIVDGVFRGEDMAFFQDIRDHGYTVWMDLSVDVGHIGAKEYAGSIKNGMQVIN